MTSTGNNEIMLFNKIKEHLSSGDYCERLVLVNGVWYKVIMSEIERLIIRELDTSSNQKIETLRLSHKESLEFNHHDEDRNSIVKILNHVTISIKVNDIKQVRIAEIGGSLRPDCILDDSECFCELMTLPDDAIALYNTYKKVCNTFDELSYYELIYNQDDINLMIEILSI